MRIIVAALLLVPALARAQSIEAGIVGLDGRHRLLAPLGGPVLQVVTGDATSRVRWQFSLERLAGTQDRIGVPCVGFVPPDEDCSLTEMRDDVIMATLGAGPRIALLKRPRLEIAGIVTGRVGRVTASSFAPARARQFDAQETMFGGDLGACASWQPFARVPVAATTALSVGQLVPLSLARVQDGYEPFQDNVPYARIQVGLAWR